MEFLIVNQSFFDQISLQNMVNSEIAGSTYCRVKFSQFLSE